MPMPIDLVFVRHGESEGNVAQRRAKQGDFALDCTPFAERLAADWRLTTRGRAQAAAAGAWIREHVGTRFDRAMVSPYARAKETAGLLALPDAAWLVEPFLREREYGDYDLVPRGERAARFAESLRVRAQSRFYWIPPSGESIAQLCLRIDRVFGTLHREAPERAILVCHGEVMWAVRIRLERLPVERFEQLVQSDDPLDRIGNGCVLHYTRRDPRTGEVGGSYHWVRIVDPTTAAHSDRVWQEIVRRKLSNDELLASVQGIPILVDEPPA